MVYSDASICWKGTVPKKADLMTEE